uniref:Secreted protein n=1 Tax=Angiostrongylus cantonensis TaxID=6313 RepID=A0A158PAR1_ANGCA
MKFVHSLPLLIALIGAYGVPDEDVTEKSSNSGSSQSSLAGSKAKNEVAVAANSEPSSVDEHQYTKQAAKDEHSEMIFVTDKIIEKLSQPWNHFACAESVRGYCKLSETIQICFYEPNMLIVMGFPLKFSEDELPIMKRLQKWITNCDASLKENANRLADIRRKIRHPVVNATG